MFGAVIVPPLWKIMATPNKRPTNTDIMNKLNSMDSTLEDHATRIKGLENWKIAVDAAKEALKEYRLREGSRSNDSEQESISNKALIAVITVIGVLAAVILNMAK